MLAGRISGRSLLIIVFLVLLLFLGSGCGLYLHNPEKATIAKETLDEFNNFKKGTNIYEAMLENLQNVQAKTAELQAETGKQYEMAFSNRIFAVTWKDILIKFIEIKGHQTIERKRITNELEQDIKEMGGVKKEKAVKKAVREANTMQARQALFQGTIKFLGNVAASSDKKLNLATLDEGKNKIMVQQIEITELDEKNGTLKPGESTVGQVLNEDIPGSSTLPFSNLLQRYTLTNLNPEKAPGLTVDILGLAEDLAGVQRDREKLGAKYITEFEKLQKDLEEPYSFKGINIIKQEIDKGILIRNEEALASINRLRKQGSKKAAEGVRRAFQALAYYGVAKTLDESALMALENKRYLLKHQYSIELSAINARAHEALISRGLQGLAIYHEGGITQELIANFLRAAQAAALAVISAGVL